MEKVWMQTSTYKMRDRSKKIVLVNIPGLKDHQGGWKWADQWIMQRTSLTNCKRELNDDLYTYH